MDLELKGKHVLVTGGTGGIGEAILSLLYEEGTKISFQYHKNEKKADEIRNSYSDNCIIGTSVVIYRGARLGKKVLVADLSTVRENVEIGDYTIVGRGVAIENYCRIGSYSGLFQ